MSELEPHKRSRKAVTPRHIPQLVVPIPLAQTQDFVRDALKGTSLVDPVASYFTGWVYFEPHLRYSAVDATHTRIEIDVVGRTRGAETLLFAQRRGEIDRFFVAIQDELDRRKRWEGQPPAGDVAIDPAD